MRIIGPPSATPETVERTCIPFTARSFLTEMLPHLWAEALRYGIDPVGVVAQSIKETAGGHFDGKVSSMWCNTAGIKVRYQQAVPGVTSGDEPMAHQMFPNWQTGARAHAQHLRAYAGWPIDPDDLVVDPRYTYVIGKHRCENWSELGGKWAPSPSYGTEIETLMTRLRG